MSHLSNRGGVTRNFAAQQAAMRHHYRAVIQTNRMMQQNLLLSRSAVTEVVQGLAEKPPTTEELQLLAEIASDVEEHDLDAEEVRARLGDTRLWQLLQVLARQERPARRSVPDAPGGDSDTRGCAQTVATGTA